VVIAGDVNLSASAEHNAEIARFRRSSYVEFKVIVMWLDG
jgi:hypothetical protein